MNWLDIVIIALIIISVFSGLMLGFITALLSAVGMIGGVILASNFYKELAGTMTFISNESLADIVAFCTILLAVTIVIFWGLLENLNLVKEEI